MNTSTIDISDATQFFLPMYEGDHSAFAPYRLGECTPDAADMDGFIQVTLDGAASYFEGANGDDAASLYETLMAVQSRYASDPVFANELKAWCLDQATQHAAGN